MMKEGQSNGFEVIASSSEFQYEVKKETEKEIREGRDMTWKLKLVIVNPNANPQGISTGSSQPTAISLNQAPFCGQAHNDSLWLTNS